MNFASHFHQNTPAPCFDVWERSAQLHSLWRRCRSSPPPPWSVHVHATHPSSRPLRSRRRSRICTITSSVFCTSQLFHDAGWCLRSPQPPCIHCQFVRAKTSSRPLGTRPSTRSHHHRTRTRSHTSPAIAGCEEEPAIRPHQPSRREPVFETGEDRPCVGIGDMSKHAHKNMRSGLSLVGHGFPLLIALRGSCLVAVFRF